MLKTPEEYGIIVKNNIVLFQKSPLSQWFGSYDGQNYPFVDKIAKIDGTQFNCCEQFMMASKAVAMNDIETYNLIMNEKDASKQKVLGRKIKNFDAAKWDRVKEKVVYMGNYWKFTQNEDLKDFLLQFPRGILFAEAAPWDSIWGIGLGPDDPAAENVSTWKGSNLLGEAIRKVHLQLISEQS